MTPGNAYSTLDVLELPRQSRLGDEALAAAAANRRRSWLILGLITLLYVGTCFTPVIFDDNEGLYTGAVREMHQRGDWMMPTTNGFARVQKPPLVYWTMLVSTSVLGGSEFALRLPNALATAAWIMATYLIMRRLGGESFGVASAVVLASMLGVWVFTHLVQPEPFLACFISLSLWCLVEARSTAQPQAPHVRPGLFRDRFEGDPWYLLFWVFLGLGSMAKGLHGALWPLGTALLAACFLPGWRPWLKPIFSLRGFGAFLLLVLPWYVWMTIRLPGFLHAHFLNEQLGATLNTRFPPDAKQLSLAQFYLQHFLFWMPWTLFLPASIYVAMKAIARVRRQPHAYPPQTLDIVGLLVCWLSLTFVSVAFSTRQDYYTMTSWGVAAAFLAMPFLSASVLRVRLPRLFLLVPGFLVAGGGAAALGFATWIRPRLGELGELTAAPAKERDTFVDAISGISPGLWGQFITLLWIFGAVMMLAGSAMVAFNWLRRDLSSLLTLGAATAVPVILAAVGFTMVSPYFSLAQNARAINREIATRPDAIVACEALPNTASSLYYYLNARVHWVNAPFNNQYAQQVLGQGRDFYWDDNRLLEEWHSAHPVYLIIEESRHDYWQGQLPTAARVVSRNGTRLVLCNR